MDAATVPSGRQAPRTDGTVRTFRCGRDELYRRAEELIAVAVAAFGAPPWQESPAHATGAVLRLLRESGCDDFAAVLGVRDGSACGFAYGLRSRELETLAHARPSTSAPFELRELALDVGLHGSRVGVALHDAMMDAVPVGPKWLITHPAARPALGLYRSRGWRAAALCRPAGSQTRLVMHRPR
jgi:hypothetical protein